MFPFPWLEKQNKSGSLGELFRDIPNFRDCCHNFMDLGKKFFCFIYIINAQTNCLCFHRVMLNGFKPLNWSARINLFILQIFISNENNWKLPLFPWRIQLFFTKVHSLIFKQYEQTVLYILNEMMWTAGIQMKWVCDHRSESQFKQLRK